MTGTGMGTGPVFEHPDRNHRPVRRQSETRATICHLSDRTDIRPGGRASLAGWVHPYRCEPIRAEALTGRLPALPWVVGGSCVPSRSAEKPDIRAYSRHIDGPQATQGAERGYETGKATAEEMTSCGDRPTAS
ncbi:hypothetical protein GCM10023223_32020 [Stackebrandtia albiflava]